MEEVILPARDSSRTFFEQVLGHYDAPAYVRRARRVEEALRQLLERCRQQRADWLDMVRLRLGTLQHLAGDWQNLRPLLPAAEVAALQRLHDELQPRLRISVQPTAHQVTLRTALRDYSASAERFNRRWLQFLPEIDLEPINQLRDGYNRYYILEKECCVRSSLLAHQGFRKLEPLTVDWLLAQFPLLPVFGNDG